MIENTVIIAASTCSNSGAFTTTTTNVAEKSQCLETPQIYVYSEQIPNLQAQ